MLKYVIIFYLLFLFLLPKTYAQQTFEYFPIGTHWAYSYAYISYGGYYQMEVIEDTIIQDKICKKLKTKNAWQSYTPWIISSNCCMYFYQENEKVFYFHNDAFRQLYDFSLGAGEYILFETPQGDSIYQKIDSVGTIEENGIIRRVQYLNKAHECCYTSDTCGEICNAYYGTMLIEGIGGNINFIASAHPGICGQENNLVCFVYGTESTPTWRLWENALCDVDMVLEQTFSKRPNEKNPRLWYANSTLYIEWMDMQTGILEIYDINGSKRLEKTISEPGRSMFTMDNLPRGVYLARLNGKNISKRFWVE